MRGKRTTNIYLTAYTVYIDTYATSDIVVGVYGPKVKYVNTRIYHSKKHYPVNILIRKPVNSCSPPILAVTSLRALLSLCSSCTVATGSCF